VTATRHPAAPGPPAAPDAGAPGNSPARDVRRPAGYRYGVVLALVFALLLFIILAPSGTWSRAVGLAIETAALVVAIATARERRAVRRRRALAAGGAAAVAVLGVAAGVVPGSVVVALAGLVAFAIPFALGGGLLRMVSEQGVTLQAIAGSLAIYLLIGLLFSWIIGLVTRIDPGPYFAQGTNGSDGQRVYFSFTVLTTTGFGDLSAANSVGRALAVIEMLVGQIYLVTVLGIVVANFRGRSGARPAR
jgi:Ion channel